MTRDGHTHSKMTGPERAMLYRVAVETGLRVSELLSLKRSSFRLESDPPTVTVESADTKNRKEAELPLRPETAAELGGFLAGKMPAAKAFPMPNKSHVPRMLRRDLTEARQKWLETAQDGAQRDEKERSDFPGLRGFGWTLRGLLQLAAHVHHEPCPWWHASPDGASPGPSFHDYADDGSVLA